MINMRLVITLTPKHFGISMHKLGVNNIFIHGDLQGDVYTEITPWVISSRPN